MVRIRSLAVSLCYGVSYRELRDRQNTKMARSLMQQAVRNCKLSETLWLEYFKMVDTNHLRKRDAS